jgi:hypothetical protein
MRMLQQKVKGVALVALGLALASGAVYAQPSTLPPECKVPPNASGTVTLPPPGCKYLSADQFHEIKRGLPPGTKIIMAPIHEEFICHQTPGGCGTPGGPLGGETETFSSTGVFQLSGTGVLAGWNRIVSVSLNVKTATGPRQAGAPVQSFPTDMLLLQGAIGPGDPDFAVFEVVGGSDNGYPSPGSTTLTQLDDGTFRVDSFFDVGYRIRFVGARGGRLEGFGGTTEGTVKMQAFQ